MLDQHMILISLTRLLAMIILFMPVASAGSSPSPFVRTQILMGDVPVQISLIPAKEIAPRAFEDIGHAFDLARQIEQEISEFIPASQTTALNRRAGQPAIPIGHHLHHLLQRSLELGRLTSGYFDITFRSTYHHASYRDVLLDSDGMRARLRHSGIEIGLSGIAKGYIIDQMAERLRQLGHTNFMINAGGDLWAESPDGASPWQVGLLNQPDQADSLLCQLNLQNAAIATSGNYERGAHLVNPHTKKAVRTAMKAVSFLAPDAETADALATAAYVVGDQIVDLFEKIRRALPEVALIMTRHDGSLQFMGDWNRHIRETDLICYPQLGLEVDKLAVSLLPASS